ncbi:hypothetical protein F5883DRAFT_579634 [Diaporthe sp. PMI_573]|nr:hypothetical protein F5883DRAFT_579634 [Diaporthaceae sp. PMI_573]
MHPLSSLCNTKHRTLKESGMGRDSNDLGPDVLGVINLEELDKRAQGHQDLAGIYFGWLQEHLNVWNFSDSAAFRLQIEAWYASLRLHGYEDQHVRDTFTAWASKQINGDASCTRRLLLAQQELLSILGSNRTMQPRDFGTDQETYGIVREDKIIDISSGDDDSNVGFLGWKHPDNLRSASKSAKDTFLPVTGANKESQGIQGAENREPKDRLKQTKTGKVEPICIPSGIPPKKYISDRCDENAGHFKEQCPTNLDPSFGPRPTGGYQCYCCGAKEKHLTTLCPLSENPDSVTQHRIRAGVPLMEPSSPLGEADRYRPSHPQSRKAEKTPSRSTDNDSTRETHRAIGQFDEGDDHRMDPARRARLKRNDRGGSPPRYDRMRGLKRSHYSPPRERRCRGSRINGPQRGRQTKRARRWRKESRTASRSSHREREGSTELMPRVGHHYTGDNHVSSWDDRYQDFKVSDTFSSKETRRLVPAVYPSDNLEAEIQHIHPDADLSWVSEMASFDVNKFFHGLDNYKFTSSGKKLGQKEFLP